jgi:hypothetical protein
LHFLFSNLGFLLPVFLFQKFRFHFQFVSETVLIISQFISVPGFLIGARIRTSALGNSAWRHSAAIGTIGSAGQFAAPWFPSIVGFSAALCGASRLFRLVWLVLDLFGT